MFKELKATYNNPRYSITYADGIKIMSFKNQSDLIDWMRDMKHCYTILYNSDSYYLWLKELLESGCRIVVNGQNYNYATCVWLV